jgi:hypothetical protein
LPSDQGYGWNFLFAEWLVYNRNVLALRRYPIFGNVASIGKRTQVNMMLGKWNVLCGKTMAIAVMSCKRSEWIWWPQRSEKLFGKLFSVQMAWVTAAINGCAFTDRHPSGGFAKRLN